MNHTSRQIQAPPVNRALPNPATAHLRDPHRIQRIRERGGERAVRHELAIAAELDRAAALRAGNRKS